MLPTFASGDRLKASQLNAMTSYIGSLLSRVSFLESKLGSVGGLGQEPAVSVRIKNDTGQALAKWQIVRLDAQALFEDTGTKLLDSTYLQDRVISATTPDSDSAGRWGIVAAGAAVGEMSVAYISGIAKTYVDVKDDYHEYAECADGEINLVSAENGTARIIDRKGGTGLQWAIVQWPVGGGGETGDVRWVSVGAPTLGSSGSAQFSISEAAQSIPTGYPIRWTSGYETFYGIVTDCTNDGSASTYDYAGPEMDAVDTLDYDQYNLATMMHLFVEGFYSAPTETDLMWNLNSVRVRWELGQAYLVRVLACQGGDSTTTQPIINVSIDDSNILTTGIQMVSSAWVACDANDINPDNYGIAFGENIKIAVTTAGTGATEAKDLNVELVFVAP